MRKPRLFVGCSTEAIRVAEAIQANLEGDAEVTLWKNTFGLASRSILDSLFERLDQAEFGVFLLTPDDLTNIRDKAMFAPRDNVVLELGMFLGRLGPAHSLMVVPASKIDLHLPTDLAGILFATYDDRRSDGNLTAALGPACSQIRAQLAAASNHKQRFTDKTDIDATWQGLLAQAGHGVKVLAGDISWAERDHEIVAASVRRGVTFEVLLCRPPSATPASKRNLQLMLATGASIRFLDPSHRTAVRGLIVDSETDEAGVAFQIRKVPRRGVVSGTGRPGDSALYVYNGIYYDGDSRNEVRIMRDLFDSLYSTAADACVLTPQELSLAEVAKLLASCGIEQYAGLRASDVGFEVLSREDLWASCRFVKMDKLRAVRSLVRTFELQGIQRFVPCKVGRSGTEALLLPPIVERHAAGFVVVDGMHRLFQQFNESAEAPVRCLSIQTSESLPSKPIPFRQVTLVPHKVPRLESFVEYDAARFRRMKILDDRLSRYWETTGPAG